MNNISPGFEPGIFHTVDRCLDYWTLQSLRLTMTIFKNCSQLSFLAFQLTLLYRQPQSTIKFQKP